MIFTYYILLTVSALAGEMGNKILTIPTDAPWGVLNPWVPEEERLGK